MLVLCHVHIRSHSGHEYQETITLLEGGNSVLPFGLREHGAHCIAMEILQRTYPETL